MTKKRENQPKSQAQVDAESRAATWQKLSLTGQLASLDNRRGNSTRQKARIQARLDAAKKTTKTEPKTFGDGVKERDARHQKQVQKELHDQKKQ